MFIMVSSDRPSTSKTAVTEPTATRLIILFRHSPEMPCLNCRPSVLIFNAVTSPLLVSYNPSPFEGHYPLPHIVHYIPGMGSHNNGCAPLVYFLKQFHNLPGSVRVQVAGRLVGNKQR